MTQEEMVVKHLAEYGSITSLEAMREYGVMRLSAVIYELKRAGFTFKTVTERGVNRYGQKTSYARYFLEKVE